MKKYDDDIYVNDKELIVQHFKVIHKKLNKMNKQLEKNGFNKSTGAKPEKIYATIEQLANITGISVYYLKQLTIQHNINPVITMDKRKFYIEKDFLETIATTDKQLRQKF